MGGPTERRNSASRTPSPRKPSVEELRQQIVPLLSAGRKEEALRACTAAIGEMPAIPGFHLLKAACLLDLGRHEEAILTVDPLLANAGTRSAPAFIIQAQALWQVAREAEAIAALKAGIPLAPDDHHMHELLGRYCLTLGEFDVGWREYEHRLARLPNPRPDMRRWAGEDLNGKRLIVIAEQGLGDTLQFLRYLPLLRQRGASLTAVVQPSLIDLARSVDPAITWTSDLRAAGTFDLRMDLLSLPFMLGTRMDTIPRRIPYVVANADKVAAWAETLGREGFRIGLAWQGSVGPMRDDARSIPPALFKAPCGQTPRAPHQPSGHQRPRTACQPAARPGHRAARSRRSNRTRTALRKSPPSWKISISSSHQTQ